MLERIRPSSISRYGWGRRLRRWRPPPVPTGWRTGPPDFVGVGAQRSGSGWWYHAAIESHPLVVRLEGQDKELHYFDRFWNYDMPADMVERYHRFFPRPEGTITGEWTPRYMHDHWSMRLLHQAAPETRILVLLRDPIERLRSGLGIARRRGITFGRGGTLDAIAAAVARGAYAEQLERVFDLFPRERVLVLQYERCLADPPTEAARTIRFLGLEPTPEPPPELRERRIPPTSGKPDLSSPMHQDLVARLGRDVERVASLCPEIDLSLWPNFRHLVSAAGRPPVEAE